MVRVRVLPRRLLHYIIYYTGSIIVCGFICLFVIYLNSNYPSRLQRKLLPVINRHINLNDNTPSSIDNWLPISTQNNLGFVYSAYFDHRIDIIKAHAKQTQHTFGIIRIIALLESNLVNSTLICNLRYKHRDSELYGYREITASSIQPFQDQNDSMYKVVYIICDLQFVIKSKIDRTQIENLLLPQYVAISDTKTSNSHLDKQFVKIHYPLNELILETEMDNVEVFKSFINRTLFRNVLTVCVKTTVFEDMRPLRIVEFIEIYLNLGANHFIFYNETINPNLEYIFDYYSQKNIITVLPWVLKNVHLNESVAMNDCLYRSIIRHSKLTAIVNFNEFILPVNYDSLIDLLNDIYFGWNMYSEFNFKTVLHYYRRKDLIRNSENYLLSPLLTQRFILRTTNVQRNSGTYIVQTYKIVELGFNHSSKCLSDCNRMNISGKFALSHEFKECKLSRCWPGQFSKDSTSIRFGNKAASKILNICRNDLKTDWCLS